MVRITDRDFWHKMICMETLDLIRDCSARVELPDFVDPPFDGEGNFLQIYRDWHIMRAAFHSEMENWPDSDFNECFAMIYGIGGWHRYRLTVGGELQFSESHASLKNIEKAKQVGFDTY